MKRILSVVAVLFCVAVFAQFASAVPTAIYDPASGNIDWTELEAPAILLLISEGGNLEPTSTGLPADSGNVDNGDIPYAITWFGLPEVLAPDMLPGGNLVMPGTPVEDLMVQYFPTLTGGSFPGVVEVIPEPASFALAGACVIGLVGFRRRRSS